MRWIGKADERCEEGHDDAPLALECGGVSHRFESGGFAAAVQRAAGAEEVRGACVEVVGLGAAEERGGAGESANEQSSDVPRGARPTPPQRAARLARRYVLPRLETSRGWRAGRPRASLPGTAIAIRSQRYARR